MSKKVIKKDKLILENFSRIFNKIKRLNESAINEIDYQTMYHKMDDVGDQREKINDLPTPDSGLVDTWIENITKDPRGSWPLEAVKAVKVIYDKHKNGEELTPDEKKLIRFRNSGKQHQANRIKNRSGDVLRKRYVESSRLSLPQYQNQVLDATASDKPIKLGIMDEGKLNFDEKDKYFYFGFKVKNGQYLTNLRVFPDGSYGFYKSDGTPINYNFKFSDYGIIKDTKQLLFQAQQEFSKNNN